MAMPAREARIAGLCYLLVIAGGVFAALFVRDRLFVPGDAAATAAAIRTHEPLWRWGIAVHLLYLLPGAAVGVILYRLFKPTQATLALLALALTLCDVGLEALLLSILYLPLVLDGDAGVLAALDATHRDALAYLAVRAFHTGWSFALFLFSGFCALVGVLVLRSRLLPRLIGVSMLAAGAGYFASALVKVLAPELGFLLGWLMVPPFLGELSLALWLTFRGVPATARGAG
jgi:hypothetical protein